MYTHEIIAELERIAYIDRAKGNALDVMRHPVDSSTQFFNGWKSQNKLLEMAQLIKIRLLEEHARLTLENSRTEPQRVMFDALNQHDNADSQENDYTDPLSQLTYIKDERHQSYERNAGVKDYVQQSDNYKLVGTENYTDDDSKQLEKSLQLKLLLDIDKQLSVLHDPQAPVYQELIMLRQRMLQDNELRHDYELRKANEMVSARTNYNRRDHDEDFRVFINGQMQDQGRDTLISDLLASRVTTPTTADELKADPLASMARYLDFLDAAVADAWGKFQVLEANLESTDANERNSAEDARALYKMRLAFRAKELRNILNEASELGLQSVIDAFEPRLADILQYELTGELKAFNERNTSLSATGDVNRIKNVLMTAIGVDNGEVSAASMAVDISENLDGEDDVDHQGSYHVGREVGSGQEDNHVMEGGSFHGHYHDESFIIEAQSPRANAEKLAEIYDALLTAEQSLKEMDGKQVTKNENTAHGELLDTVLGYINEIEAMQSQAVVGEAVVSLSSDESASAMPRSTYGGGDLLEHTSTDNVDGGSAEVELDSDLSQYGDQDRGLDQRDDAQYGVIDTQDSGEEVDAQDDGGIESLRHPIRHRNQSSQTEPSPSPAPAVSMVMRSTAGLSSTSPAIHGSVHRQIAFGTDAPSYSTEDAITIPAGAIREARSRRFYAEVVKRANALLQASRCHTNTSMTDLFTDLDTAIKHIDRNPEKLIHALFAINHHNRVYKIMNISYISDIPKDLRAKAGSIIQFMFDNAARHDGLVKHLEEQNARFFAKDLVNAFTSILNILPYREDRTVKALNRYKNNIKEAEMLEAKILEILNEEYSSEIARHTAIVARIAYNYRAVTKDGKNIDGQYLTEILEPMMQEKLTHMNPVAKMIWLGARYIGEARRQKKALSGHSSQEQQKFINAFIRTMETMITEAQEQQSPGIFKKLLYKMIIAEHYAQQQGYVGSLSKATFYKMITTLIDEQLDGNLHVLSGGDEQELRSLRRDLRSGKRSHEIEEAFDYRKELQRGNSAVEINAGDALSALAVITKPGRDTRSVTDNREREQRVDTSENGYGSRSLSMNSFSSSE
ncbi:MAG: hypothetical protein CMF50_06465 [Legionellales bacterium]|nr:hypothetical protein [Legionellales bacterium]|tara:strand:- start:1191 stop:4424 length:3234 start_codon:yes stop_codon:yes gene_type:complete